MPPNNREISFSSPIDLKERMNEASSRRTLSSPGESTRRSRNEDANRCRDRVPGRDLLEAQEGQPMNFEPVVHESSARRVQDNWKSSRSQRPSAAAEQTANDVGPDDWAEALLEVSRAVFLRGAVLPRATCAAGRPPGRRLLELERRPDPATSVCVFNFLILHEVVAGGVQRQTKTKNKNNKDARGWLRKSPCPAPV